MKIYAETYGCTMNQGDTELMLGDLVDSGHKVVQDIEDSDLIIVNTCAVTRTTLNKVVYRLKELHEEYDQDIVVAGCLPLIDLSKIEDIGNFSGIISCRTTQSIGGVVARISQGEDEIRRMEGEPEKLRGRRFRSGGVSSPIPIAEGCLSDCSYCCVKFARGRLKSYDPEKIVREVERELRAGRREIYLTTQDTAAYGLDIGTDLPTLLKKVTSPPEKFRVRVGMMNPHLAKRITPELLEAYDTKKIYTFLHLPVQSGSDQILEKMRRGYRVRDFKEIVHSFREKFERLYLATDIIVGFPGESRKDFEDSCELMREIKPDKINITRFTPMPGTEAKEMDQVDSEEKKRRSREMTSIHHEISHEKNQRYVGYEGEGLVIRKGKKGGYEARLPNYKPVIVEKAEPGEFVRIKITKAEPTYLMGKITEVGM